MTESSRTGVVVHLDEGDPAKHASVLRNLGNLLDTLGPQTRVELVVHGAGIDLLLEGSPHSENVRALQDRGLTVDACGNTLSSASIARERLLPGAVVVPSGVAHLVIRQREGWAYVRP
ncbi:DsrE family protein [Leifsonia sp. 22587]|uniref:DsrE family protein n=1 Tax=Leifsonia sp. 22587 TaxID=3453946 RepID=UPI003F82DCF1